MTPEESKQLKVDDQVQFSDNVGGTVREISQSAVAIVWDDDPRRTLSWIDHRDMRNVTKIEALNKD